MNKRIVIVFLSSLMLFLSSCGMVPQNEESPFGETNTDEGFSNGEMSARETLDTEPTVDDIVFQTEPLESGLTNEYDLEDLKAFFEGHSHADSFLGISKPTLYYSQVNERYPIEITRSRNYSVYRVKQGGYFYVFWVQCYPNNNWQETPELAVDFCTYITPEKSLDFSDFESLVCGKSTAEDVKKIDPYFQLSFLSSSGVFSYSFLDGENVLEIEYSLHENIYGYQDLIVKGMTVVRRDCSPRYGMILSDDLP